MATLSISEYYDDPANWGAAGPDYLGLLNVIGGGANTSHSDTALAILNTSTRSPVCLAFILADEANTVYIGHSLMKLPGDILNVPPYDNHVVALVGDDLATAVPVVLPSEAFQRTNAINCLTAAEITGVNGHGANPPVLRAGPHAGGVPNTHNLRARRAMLLPPATAGEIISGSVNGTYTLPGF